MGKYLKLFDTHAEYETYSGGGGMILPNVSYCEDNNGVHYNPLPIIIATDDTNLPLMNIARTYGWVKQDATEFYDSEANNVTDITGGIVNTFVNTHTQETVETPFGEQTLDLWYDKNENKWYDATELLGADDFTLANLSLKTIRPIKSQDGETASLYEGIDWTNIEHFNEFKYFTSITSIGQAAFSGCSGLISIIIPDSVTSIGANAFRYCDSLASVTIPNSVTSIGERAFYYCTSLSSITIPDGVTSIGQYVFSNCSGLTSVTIGSGITSISDDAFYHCDSLSSVAIPDSVTSIGIGAFRYCSSLTSVTIPNSVTIIGIQAFEDCTSLMSIVIPDSVTRIDSWAFRYCSITSITSLATTAPGVDQRTFEGIKANGTLTVPSGSSGYDVWMGSGDYYLGKYNWTKVEQ